jgi:hypothetical protein
MFLVLRSLAEPAGMLAHELDLWRKLESLRLNNLPGQSEDSHTSQENVETPEHHPRQSDLTNQPRFLFVFGYFTSVSLLLYTFVSLSQILVSLLSQVTSLSTHSLSVYIGIPHSRFGRFFLDPTARSLSPTFFI